MNTATIASTFHAGEIALQQRAGMHERVARMGARMIQDRLPEEHREFFTQLPTLIVGSVDADQRPWASVLAGWPGFIETPDERTLRVDAVPPASSRLQAQLGVGAPLGLLGIEPQTRSRLRVNGTVVAMDATGFEVRIEQSFGNCPQYIQARAPTWTPRELPNEGPRAEGAALSEAALASIAGADTLFIASAAPPALRGARHGGVDVSHRGGRPGFVHIACGVGATVLTLPDYRGNFFFNTLGNIEAWPYAGLLFIDHAEGDTLQLTGRAEIVWDAVELREFKGAQRLLRIRVEAGVWTPRVLPFAWSPPVFAPQLA